MMGESSRARRSTSCWPDGGVSVWSPARDDAVNGVPPFSLDDEDWFTYNNRDMSLKYNASNMTVQTTRQCVVPS